MRQIPEGFIIPDFGKASGAPSAQVGASSEGASYDGPRKMALICSKGNLDMAYPGLILGNSAAGEGIETHIFFTFWGLDIVNKKTNDKLQFTMIGHTAMHMPDLGNVKPGLVHWLLRQFIGRPPGMTKAPTTRRKKQMEDLEIPTVPEFLDLLQASGVHMYACKLSFDMMKMLEADLHPAVEGVISAADFIEISTGAQTLFI